MVDKSPGLDETKALRPWASLLYRDYRWLFIASLFVTTAQHMRQTQNYYQVYELSGSAFQLGLTGLAQGIPLVAVGLLGGTLVDFVDRRKLLLLTIAGNLLVAVMLGILTLTGAIRVWHILLGTALTSGLNIILNPARMAMISGLVPRTHLTNAASLNSSASQSSHFVGPMLAGLSLAWMPIGNAYLCNALFYLPAAVGILWIETTGPSAQRKEIFSMLSFLGGLRFVFSQPIVFVMVMLDFVITGVGYYRPLLPIFAKDILSVGPAGFGVLSSAPAVGGIIGTFLLLTAGNIRYKGMLALTAFFSYGIGLGLFAISSHFAWSLFLLGVLGLANSTQAVMRQTTFHLLTPDHLRGRAFAVFNIFSQGANSVGATEVGFMAALIGASGSLLVGCAVALTVSLGCWATLPGLRQFGVEETKPEALT